MYFVFYLLIALAMGVIGNAIFSYDIVGSFNFGSGLIEKWKFPQYLFDYQFGFQKRSFVGALLNALGIEANTTVVWMFSIACFVALALLSFAFLNYMLADLPQKQKLVFMVLFALSPAVFMRFGYDIGRFDLLNESLAIIALWLIVRGQILWSAPVVVVGIFVHEVFLLMSVPLLVAVAYDRSIQKKISITRLLVFLSTILAATIVTFIYFKTNEQSVASLVERSNSVFGQDLVTYQAFEVLNRTVFENMELTYIWALSKFNFFNLLMALPFFGLMLALYSFVGFKSLNFQQKLVWFSAFTPFLLLLVATDYYRWTGLVVFNMFIVFSYLIWSRGGLLNASLFEAKRKFLFLALACSFLGPLGGTKAFPLVSSIVKYSSLNEWARILIN